MAFPIYPNNYNSLIPAPHLTEEPNTFSEGIRRVKLLRGAHLECATLALVWIDIALMTHQIVLDYSLSPQNASLELNATNWTADPPTVFQANHPTLTHRASIALFIAITAMAFIFLIESIARNIHSRVMLRRFIAINVCDAALCAASFMLNLILLLTRVNPLIRDFVALLIVFRLARMVNLMGGLTHLEKQQVIRMLDGYRREESFNAEHQRMLQTELDNRTKECQDLRELVKSATLARNRLRQKQQLQMEQQTELTTSTDILSAAPKRPGGGGLVTGEGNEDSGHSSDASPSPDSPPLEAFGRVPIDTAGGGNEIGACGTPTDIELTGVTHPADAPEDDQSVTSKM